MKKVCAPKTLALSAVLILCSIAIGCGSSATDPRPINVTVQSTANPLVAQFSIVSPCSGQAMVEFGTDTTYGRSTAWYPIFGTGAVATSAQPLPILVAGMRAKTTYHMRAQVQCPDGVYPSQDLTFATGALPSLPFPKLTVTRPSPSPSSPENPGVESVAVVNPPGAPLFVTDRDANPIWYYDIGQGNTPTMFKLLSNGHILMLINTTTTTLLREVDLAGNAIRQIDIPTLDQEMAAAGFDFQPGTFHHDFAPLPNGHVIALVGIQKTETAEGYGTLNVLGDGLVDLDQNWNPVWAWNSFDQVEPNGPLDINRHLNGLPDWTHSNAILYMTDGNLLLSMRHQSWLLKIDYNNGTGAGDIIWRLGYQGDFALTQNEVPTDDPSLWFSFQHFPSFISQDGSQILLNVWDNGDGRVLDTNGDLCSQTPGTGVFCYSRATKFQVDESAKVADLQWADAPGYFSIWGGSVNQLENGNVEFDVNDPVQLLPSGIYSQVQEVTQTPSPQIVWQMNVSNVNAYRAYRIPSLYPNVTWQY
jgi:arylsulfate sulfotransferase